MDIGTAKPGAELQKTIPHHLIDIRDPDEPFSAGDFVRLADAACEDIAGRSKLPVISGGTGFYLKNFIFGLTEAPPADGELRESLKKEYLQKGPDALLEELRRRDGESAERIHVNDRYRFLRALEICRLSGRPVSSFAPKAEKRSRYRFLIAGIKRPREELYRRINRRCDEMFRRGLPAEVEALYKTGYTPSDPGLQAIGYREFFVESTEEGETAGKGPSYTLSGDLEGVKALTAQNSRRYAKRQETFFSSIPDVVWLGGDDGKPTVSSEPWGEPRGALDLLSSLIHTLVNSRP
jgi:tRNA dimethylallyltransferase